MRGLHHRCDIYRADEDSKQTDSWNQETDASFALATGSQRCRLVWPLIRGNKERFDGLQQRTVVADAAVFLPADADIRVDDEIRNVTTPKGEAIAVENFNVLRILSRGGIIRSHQKVEVQVVQSAKAEVG